MTIRKEYKNKEITIIWQPTLCTHSTKCFRSLPKAFDPRRKPWIIADSEPSEKLIETIKNCPSGALSFVYNEEK